MVGCPADNEYASLLLESPSTTGNVLTKQSVDALWDLHDIVMTIEVNQRKKNLPWPLMVLESPGYRVLLMLVLLCEVALLVAREDDTERQRAPPSPLSPLCSFCNPSLLIRLSRTGRRTRTFAPGSWTERASFRSAGSPASGATSGPTTMCVLLCWRLETATCMRACGVVHVSRGGSLAC